MLERPSSDPDRWRAVLARDASADGEFVFGVTTTGIFCKPSCAARRPRREHVRFFDTPTQAERAGLRPCKRCRPTQADEALTLCRAVLDVAAERPAARWSDAELARRGFDPVRVRRAFRARFGGTFQSVWRGRRAATARAGLARGLSLPEAAQRAGFESESGAAAAIGAVLGASPSTAVARRLIRVTRLDSPLGPLLCGADDAGVCLVEFDDQGAGLDSPRLARVAQRLDAAAIVDDHPHLARLAEELCDYFDGSPAPFTVPLALAGSAFELAVWRALVAIPRGETRGYGELARALARPGAARAVGRANSRNPVAILVPCHRVVGASGALTGYAGGEWRKRRLIELERGD